MATVATKEKKNTMKINPMNIGYIDQVKRFGLGFAVVSFIGDLETSAKIKAADHMLEKLNKEAEKKAKKVAEEAAKADTEESKEDSKDEKEETGIMEYNDVSVGVKVNGDGETTVEDKEFGPVVLTDDQLDTNIEAAISKLSHIPEREVRLGILGILYIGSVIDTEQVMKRLDNKNVADEIEFLNSFTKFFTGIVMVTGYNSFMINDIFSKMKNLEDIVKFEATYEGIEQNDAIDHVLEKSRELMVEFERATLTAHGEKDPDPVVPLVFINKNMELGKHQNVTKQQIAALNKALAGIIEQYQYQFNGINGLIELVIQTDGRFDSYKIDPGTIIGNGYNLIYQVNNMTYYINISKHKDIVAKILANRYYMLTPQEFQLIAQDIFTNPMIYAMVDMSKGPEFLPKISPEEFNKLGKKLTFIMNLDWSKFADGRDGLIPCGRLRFRSFKSIDDFTLVSDNKCKTPLPGVLWSNVSEGLSVKVVGNDIIVKKGEAEPKKYTITSYNEM